jgi:hypothetical protein
MLSGWQNAPAWWPLAMMLFGIACLAPVWSDLFRDRVVPDLFTYPLTLAAGVLLLAGPGRLVHLLAFTAAWLAFYLVCSAGKMGWGDLKLILPMAALAGANFLVVVFAAFVCALPLSLRSSWRKRTAHLRGEHVTELDQMAPFGPGAVAGAQITWLAMGLPLWVGAVWAAGWIAVLVSGMREARRSPHASPQRVREWADQGRTGALGQISGRPVGWLQRKAIMQALLDDEHFREAYMDGRTSQDLAPGSSQLQVERTGSRFELSLSEPA